jgi:hypothetical protein
VVLAEVLGGFCRVPIKADAVHHVMYVQGMYSARTQWTKPNGPHFSCKGAARPTPRGSLN